MFVDRAKITIRSGKGGNGSVSFRREPFVPQGGPDGGDGGKGGDIVIRADEGLRTMMYFRYNRKYVAENGEDGKKKKCFIVIDSKDPSSKYSDNVRKGMNVILFSLSKPFCLFFLFLGLYRILRYGCFQ